VLALVADIANFYKKKVTHLVKTQFTQNLINTLQRFMHIKENELMIKYAVHVNLIYRGGRKKNLNFILDHSTIVRKKKGPQ